MNLKIKAVGAYYTPAGVVADTVANPKYADYTVDNQENIYNLYVTSKISPAAISVRIPVELEKDDVIFMNGFQSATESREMTVDESVKLAEGEIKAVFDKGDTVPVVRGVDTGKYGQIVGKCPVCGKNVVRGRFNYGCIGFDEGCKFRMGINICRRDIPIMEVARLLETGSTDFMAGFISKNGKRFDARFVVKDGNAVFDFERT